MAPALANGKICYVEIPAIDVSRSVLFYREVFGWTIRRRGDGSTAFDDPVGEVSGQPIGVDAPEITARFRDPAANVIGLYQQRDQSS
jgi:uncharacterized protein